MNKKRRILLGKIGLDGHTTGLYAVSKALSDAGFEVVFGGIRITADQMANIALQEDVDALGISILSGAHMTVIEKLIKSLDQTGLRNKPIIVGGIIPPEDIPKLKSLGVSATFTPGTPMEKIIKTVQRLIPT